MLEEDEEEEMPKLPNRKFGRKKIDETPQKEITEFK